MTTEGRDEKDGMDPADDQALWALLGRQELPTKVSPYFSRRVLREVTLAEERRATGWWTRVRGMFPVAVFSGRGMWWSGALSGLCALVLVCLAHPLRPTQTAPVPGVQGTEVAEATPAEMAADTPASPTPQAAVPAQDVEVIADLDNILQREESRLWTDDTARF